MRPVYETADDREREEMVANAVSAHFRVDLEREDKLASNDYRLVKDGKVFALLEVKFRRGYNWTDLRFMGSYMLSFEKWWALWKLCQSNDLALCLAVSDKLSEIWASTWRGSIPLYDVSDGGRRDRGDKKDIEPCVFIPIDEFDILIKDRELTEPKRG